MLALSKQKLIADVGKRRSFFTLENLSSCALAIILPSLINVAAESW